MKWFCFLLLALLISSALLAQDPIISRSEGSITFKVSNVEKCNIPLSTVPSSEAYQFRTKHVCEGLPQFSEVDSLVPVSANGFLAAFHLGFAKHYPVVVSPDIVWLVLCQGLSTHIRQHSEEFRGNLVGFSGKETITVRHDEFVKGQNNNWPAAFEEFTTETKKLLKDSLFDIMIPQFSTSGVAEKIAFEITFLESVSEYFNYVVLTACGIPEITLLGTPADWKQIRKNIESFREFDLDSWVNDLEPILDEFVNASQGNINTTFWRSFYKYNDESGGSYINGHIIRFFPYFQFNPDSMYLNPFLDQPLSSNNGVSTDQFPSGLSHLNFVWDFPLTKTQYNMTCEAGFMGIVQDKNNLSLKPQIGWTVFDQKADEFNFDSLHTDSVEGLYVFGWLPFFESVGANYPYNISWFYQFTLNQYDTSAIRSYTGETEPDFSARLTPPILFPKTNNDASKNVSLMADYLNKNINPKRKKLSATIRVDFLWTGEIGEIEIVELSNEEFRSKIMDVVTHFNDFVPGFFDGVPINYQYTFLISQP